MSLPHSGSEHDASKSGINSTPATPSPNLLITSIYTQPSNCQNLWRRMRGAFSPMSRRTPNTTMAGHTGIQNCADMTDSIQREPAAQLLCPDPHPAAKRGTTVGRQPIRFMPTRPMDNEQRQPVHMPSRKLVSSNGLYWVYSKPTLVSVITY